MREQAKCRSKRVALAKNTLATLYRVFKCLLEKKDFSRTVVLG